MSEIAIFTPIHRRPDLILDQLQNYFFSHGNDAFHIFHPSIEGRPHMGDLSTLFGKVGCETHINPMSLGTSWKSVFGAYVSNTKYLTSKSVLKPKYIYLHTDADLIIKGSLSKYVFDNKIGFLARQLNPNWFWNDALSKDDRFKELKKYLSISDEEVFLGRCEGSFFPFELWLEIMSLITKFYDDNFFGDPKVHWPIEEVLIQTAIKKLYPDLKHTSIIVKTKLQKASNKANPRDIDENCVQVEDILQEIENNKADCIGMKWFSQNSDDAARLMVRKLNKSSDV